MSFQKNVAQTVQAVMVATSDHLTPTAPTGNLAASISKDGAAFETCANAPASVSNGLVTVLLTADETNCDYYTVRFTGDDCDEVQVVLYTEAAWTATRAGYLTGAVALEDTLTALNTLLSTTGIALTAVERTAIITALLAAANASTAAGTVGKQLVDAGAAGDPWAVELPGDYEAGTAGHRVGILLTGGGGITLQAASPTVVVDASGEVVGGDGRLVAVRGCTHAVTWERAGSDFSDHTIVLTCRDELEEADDDDDSEAAFTLEAVVVSATQFTTTLTPTQTDELTVGDAYWYQIKDLTTNENLLNRGRLEVVQSVVKRTA